MVKKYSAPEVAAYGSVEEATLQTNDKAEPASDTQYDGITGSIRDCTTQSCK